jgi:DNA-binding GntR family transcriptional regulator
MAGKDRRAGLESLARYARAAAPGMPKYAQLRDMLVSAIHAGHWKPGQKLPTEAALTRDLPYSLGTVQRAYRSLVEEGIVRRSQGSGTFVEEGRRPIDAPFHLQFRGDDGRFLPLYPKIVSRTRARGDGPWTAFLGATAEVLRIDRRISVGDEFDVYTRLYFDARAVPAAASMPFESLDKVHWKRLLSEELHAPVTDVRQTIRLDAFPPAVTRALGLRAGTRSLVLESAGTSVRGDPVYFLESFIPPHARRLDVSSR